MLLYRADSRTPDEMKSKYFEGFKAWTPLNVGQAREWVSKWVKKGPNGLNDLSIHIKYTKDRTTTWVSTAINEDCGGQGGGCPIYTISAELEPFGIVSGSGHLVKLNTRVSNLKPALMLDGPSIELSNILALNHGPVQDAEVSFFTAISLDRIVSCKVAGKSLPFVRTGTVPSSPALSGRVTSNVGRIQRGHIP